MSGISIIQEVNPLRESLEDPKNDMGDLEDSLGTSHSDVFLKEGKIC